VSLSRHADHLPPLARQSVPAPKSRPRGRGLAKAKANVLACDQALPGSTRRFTLRRGDPAATRNAGQAPRCVAIRQIWCHVCAHGAKLPRNLASRPGGPSPPPGPAKLAVRKAKPRGPRCPGEGQAPRTSLSRRRSSPADLAVPAKAKPGGPRCPRKASGASCLATKRAPSLSVRLTVPFLAASPGLTRLPRLVARGYLVAVPGRSDVRTTVLTRNPEPEKTLT